MDAHHPPVITCPLGELCTLTGVSGTVTSTATNFSIGEMRSDGTFWWCGKKIPERDFYEKLGRWYAHGRALNACN